MNKIKTGKCVLCGNPTSLHKRRQNYNMYCSSKCVKRTWYLKHNPNISSYLNDNIKFWDTATGIGFKWEKYAAKLLGAKHLEFNSGGNDLLLGNITIDVKAAELYRRKNRRGASVKSEQSGNWTFNRNKIKPTNYFFCVCLRNGKRYKQYLIPSKYFSNSGLCIGHKSIFDKFLYPQFNPFKD